MADLPEIAYGTVHGRFLAGILDSTDPEVAPDVVPLSGSVEFWPTTDIVLVAGASPDPTTLLPQKVCAPLDGAGYLINPDTGDRGVTLFCTDDPDGNPINWHWRAVFRLTLKGRAVPRDGFYFSLPCGSTVDLTVVAPVAEGDDGVWIIQGPAGPPGPGIGDIVTAQGDLIGGTGPAAVAAIPVGLPGEYLTPTPGAPTGLDWAPLPVPDAGLKVYADMTEVDAVRTGEVGTLHVDNLAAAFPNLAAAGHSASYAFSATGPADLVITSQATAYFSPPPEKMVYQTFDVGDTFSDPEWTAWRVLNVKANGDLIGPPPVWNVLPRLPMALYDGYVPYVWQANYSMRPSTPLPNPNSLIDRDAEGRAQIVDPAVPADIANKGYVDTAIGAIPPGTVTFPDIATAKANVIPGIAILHVDDLATAFPELAILDPQTWGRSGPAELIWETRILPYSPPDWVYLVNIVTNVNSNKFTSTAIRHLNWDTVSQPAGPFDGPFVLDPSLPRQNIAGYTLVSGANGIAAWTPYGPAVNVGGQSIVSRKIGPNTAEIGDPINPLDIANKGYVDGAIAAIPPATGGTPPVGTRNFLFDATPAGDPGAGRLSIENAGGQNRLLRLSKTDADGGAVDLTPLAVGDAVILSGGPAIYARGYAATLATDAVTHWEFTAVRESGTGALPADGTPLVLSITMANAGGSTGGGLAEYPDVAALDAVRTGEVGVLHVDDLALAFPTLAALNTSFAGHGPADIAVLTTVLDYTSDAAPLDFYAVALQSFTFSDTANAYKPLTAWRTISFDRPGGTQPDSITAWAFKAEPPIFPPGMTQGDLMVAASAVRFNRLVAPTVAGHVLTADPIQATRMRWQAPKPAPYTVQEWGGDVTVDVNYEGQVFMLNAAGPVTITLPASGATLGQQTIFVQNGAGPVTFVPGPGATIKSAGGKTVLAGLYSKATAMKLNYEQWVIDGDLVVP